jgi:hypothetical protein
VAEFISSVKKGCSSSNSFVVMTKWEKKEEVAMLLKERCPNLREVGGIMYRCSFTGIGKITYYPKTGKLLVELEEGVDVSEFLKDLFRKG